jgi:hypothetical protein
MQAARQVLLLLLTETPLLLVLLAKARAARLLQHEAAKQQQPRRVAAAASGPRQMVGIAAAPRAPAAKQQLPPRKNLRSSFPVPRVPTVTRFRKPPAANSQLLLLLEVGIQRLQPAASRRGVGLAAGSAMQAVVMTNPQLLLQRKTAAGNHPAAVGNGRDPRACQRTMQLWRSCWAAAAPRGVQPQTLLQRLRCSLRT